MNETIKRIRADERPERAVAANIAKILGARPPRPAGGVWFTINDVFASFAPDAAAGELVVARLGLVPYGDALALQHQARDARRAGAIPDTLLLLEHPPVYTRGRRATDAELPFGAEWYRSRGIEIHDVDRGGRVTYHGPGQVVGYPIVDIAGIGRDAPRFVGALEAAIVAALAAAGVDARGDRERRGVWAGERKIASIGIHVAGGVTTHGVAVNVTCDLTPFEWIVPCGLDVEMTSVAIESDHAVSPDVFGDRLAGALAAELGLRARDADQGSLREALARRAAAA